MFLLKKYFSFFLAFQFHICVSYESHIATCHNQFITFRHWLWMKVQWNVSKKKPHQFLTSLFKIVILNTCSLPYNAFILRLSPKKPKIFTRWNIQEFLANNSMATGFLYFEKLFVFDNQHWLMRFFIITKNFWRSDTR